jgi:hypothetical protein
MRSAKSHAQFMTLQCRHLYTHRLKSTRMIEFGFRVLSLRHFMPRPGNSNRKREMFPVFNWRLIRPSSGPAFLPKSPGWLQTS